MDKKRKNINVDNYSISTSWVQKTVPITGGYYAFLDQYQTGEGSLSDILNKAQNREREADIECELERLEAIDKMDDSELANPEVDAIMSRLFKGVKDD
mgnify:CR=1 FL=1